VKQAESSSRVQMERQAEGLYRLSGDLSFVTVPQLAAQGERLFQEGDSVVLDLADLGRSDSAGLALLVSWIRLARRHNKQLSFHAIPAQLLGLARVGGLEKILPRQ
jgi:phospholipid transport system transporter-binding protein